MMKNRQGLILSIVVFLTVCFRLVLWHRADLWHGETLWLMRSASESAGSPLFCLLARFWSAISHDETWLRTLPLVFSVAAVVMIYHLARRAFNGIGSTEATSLAVVSSLLCTSAWEFHPCSFEIFLAALWLFAFLKAIDRQGARDWVLHGVAALLALCANPLMVLLVPGQAAVLAIFRRTSAAILVRWMLTIAPAIGLIALLSLMGGAQSAEAQHHPAPQGSFTCYDIGYLFTDISLGRLHPWKPLPPAFTFAKPGFEDAQIAGRQIGAEGERAIHSFFQVAQFLLTTWFLFALVLACLSVWGLRTWILPSHLRSRALLRKVQEPGHETALLLLFSIFVPPLYVLLAGTPIDQPFPEQRLFFVAVPFMILVGRGLTRFQWVVIRYGFVLVVAALSFLYSSQSIGLQKVFDGVRSAASQVAREWDEGDRLVVDPFLAGPLRWYAGDLAQGAPGGGDHDGRLWTVRLNPDETLFGQGAAAFVGAAFVDGDWQDRTPFESSTTETVSTGHYTILRRPP